MGAKDISEMIKTRCAAFIDFKRKGSFRVTVMSTKSNDVTDLLPGDYDLAQLVQTQYHGFPMITIPRHSVLKRSKWKTQRKVKKEGNFICSPDWNDIIPVEFRINQLLAYYGACLAGEKEEKMALSQRHCTVNFNYSKSYHEDVLGTCSGNGLEQHAFQHMEYPLDDDSGFFLLGKWDGKDEFQLTAFKILKNHVLHVPRKHIPMIIFLELKDKADERFKLVDVTFDTSIAQFGRRSCQKCSNKTRNRRM